MFSNGTVVEGVCVTGEASRQHVPFVGKGFVPVARQVCRTAIVRAQRKDPTCYIAITSKQPAVMALSVACLPEV